jgi:lipid-binding SYLF domain-containing protein
MSKPRQRRVATFLVVMTAVALLSTPVMAGEKEDKRVRKATAAYLELINIKDKSVPQSLLDECVCVAVFPAMTKAALVFGGRHGKGIVSCRGGQGTWSPPAFFKISGGSLGFQIGAQQTELVLFFMDQDSAAALLKAGFTVGGQASVAAGPVGRSAEAATGGPEGAEILSYARSKGLFAGLSLEGASLSPHKKATRAFYGTALPPKAILFDRKVPHVPAVAREFIRALP